MNKHFSIFCSDQISKDGRSFSISALEDGIWQTAVYGVPSNISHDIHRPIGWSYAKGLYFDSDKVLTIGNFLIADTEEDFNQVNNARKNYFLNYINKNIEPHSADFISSLDSLYQKDKGNWFYNGVVLYGYENIVFEAFPDIKELIAQDKNGLINISFLLSKFDYLSQGIFKKKNSNFCLVLHPYFRKSLSIHNNFHWIFLDELIASSSFPELNVKVKLDLDFIGYAPSFISSHEFEYWWGPKYNDDISTISPGLTQYSSDEFEKLYYNIDRSEFIWSPNDNLYVFEMEEVKDEIAPTLNNTCACRYIHSIYDKDQSTFIHFDGAIRAYSTDLMLERLDKKMTEMGHSSQYTKLFRIDGKLPLNQWKSLVTNYLQGNPQIYEYFGLEKPDIKHIAKNEEKTSIEKFVPYSINEGDGIRLYISYHQKTETNVLDRSIPISDILTLADGKHNALEYFVIELKKCFDKIGATLLLPENCIYLLPEDYYSNIPCIFHSDVNTQNLLNESIEAIKLLINCLVQNNSKEILSFSLSWNIEDKEVCISFMGHVKDISKWLSSFTYLPVIREELKLWLGNQQKYIQTNSRNNSCPVLSEIIYDDGKLFFKRRLVQQDAKITFPNKSDLMTYQVECDEGKDDLAESLKKQRLFMAPCLIAERIICVKSGKDYKESPYSSIFNETTQKMDSCKLVSFHWTDKPRPIQIG